MKEQQVERSAARQRESAPAAELGTEPITELQQAYGNQAVQRMLSVGERIQNAQGGQRLDSGVQRTLESGLGANLSGVRVHTDSEADSLSRSVNAQAFTSGSDIFFRAGAFRPGTAAGLRMLAHEATHAVQQASGPVAGTPTQDGISLSHPSDAFERAADRAAQQFT